jgi:hypothetical protein
VISAIDGELAYQNSMINTERAGDRDNGVAGQLVTLSDYVRHAEAAWTQNNTDLPALDVIRKCAGICVRALILYGCPVREGSKAVPA